MEWQGATAGLDPKGALLTSEWLRPSHPMRLRVPHESRLGLQADPGARLLKGWPMEDPGLGTLVGQQWTQEPGAHSVESWTQGPGAQYDQV